MEFAAGHRNHVVGLPWVVLGEFRHGALRADLAADEVDRFLELGIPLLDPAPVIPVYAKICATLQKTNPREYQGMAQNDLWIAAVAVEAGRPVLSRNRRHFDRIPGLEVVVLGTS